MNEADLERFWAKVDKSGDCWEWTAGRGSGYGRFGLEGHVVYAHRLSYRLAYGSIPGDLCVLHHCDNPLCVNPDHLFLGTRVDNLNDMFNKNRWNPPKVRYGEKNGNSKLSRADVIEIRELFAMGHYTKIALGELFGVSDANICDIVNRRIWKHI